MASLPPVSLEPGYRLDRYELLCKIGQGGMASVWLARTQGKHGFERLVALKTVLPEHATDPSFRTMLLDEARIAAAIDHPNVARILDVGEERDIPFMVLEYVAGDSLIRLHRKLGEVDRRIPLPIVLRVLADTCSGLHVAHELTGPDGVPLGIVHRDVSPQNILVNDLGIVKLIDFGVAKATGRLAAETATGIMKGKVPYMAPEQALGTAVDRRADIWAMGSVAFLLLAGACPFDGPNDASRVVRAVTGDAPDPLPSSVPPAVAAVVFRALSRDPNDRFATAADLREALEGAARRTSLTATSEDVAKFFAENLPDSVKSRKRMLERALAAGSERARAREVLTFENSSAGRPGPQVPQAPGSDPNISTDLEETSVLTSAKAVEVLPAETRPSRKWVTLGVAGAVAFLVAGAFAVGSFTSSAGVQKASAGTATSRATPPVDTAPAGTLGASVSSTLPTPTPTTSVSVSHAPSASASASAPKTALLPPRPSHSPPVATTSHPPPPKPPKPSDETIF